MAARHYAYFDGDKVGNAINNLLRQGKMEEAAHLSEKIKSAVFDISQRVKPLPSSKVLIAGGDDLLISYDPNLLDEEIISQYASDFLKSTGLSMSYGTGETIDKALLMLSESKNSNTRLEKNPKPMIKKRTQPSDTCLWIFVTSNFPDSYVNVISHCQSHHGITKVFLIGIANDIGKIELLEDQLNEIEMRINLQIKSLSIGKYHFYDTDRRKWKELAIPIKDGARRVYIRLESIKIETKKIIYNDLFMELQSCINSTPNSYSIFDVTAVSKGHLVDIFTLLRFMGISSIYSFEIIRPRSFDDKDLIHNLNFDDDYRYTCLSNSLHTSDKTITGESALISIRQHNEVISLLEKSQLSQKAIKDICSQQFAKRWMLAYSIIGTSGLAWCIWSTLKGNWDTIEQTVVIGGLIWVLAGYLFQAFNNRQLPSMNAWNLRKQLVSWYHKNLEKHENEVSNSKK